MPHVRLLTCHLQTRRSCQLGAQISLVTRGDDATFSSFVDAVVTATIKAADDEITRRSAQSMPFMELFGNQLRFMLQDVVRYTGNYNDIYLESHDISEGDDVDRGFNSVMTVEGMRGLYWSEFPLNSCLR